MVKHAVVKRPVVKRPVVKHAVVKRPVVKHAVVKKHPAPLRKPRPAQPQVRLTPTEALPLPRAQDSSSTVLPIVWVLLEIAAALALIAILRRQRALPALSLSGIQRLYRGAETDGGAAVAVTQPQSKVARPRAKAQADTAAHVPVARPQPKVARPRAEAKADTDAHVDVTPPLRHVVAVSKVRRAHRKAEADTEIPVPPARTRRLLPGVPLPKIHRPHPEPEAEADAEPEAVVYARSYMKWLERH